MNTVANDGAPDEARLVKLYMELTGASESRARAVFMYVEPPAEHGQAERPAPEPLLPRQLAREPAPEDFAWETSSATTPARHRRAHRRSGLNPLKAV